MSRQFASRLNKLKRVTIIDIVSVAGVDYKATDSTLFSAIPSNKTTASDVVIDGDLNSVPVDTVVFSVDPLLKNQILAGNVVITGGERYQIISALSQGITNPRLELTTTIIKS